MEPMIDRRRYVSSEEQRVKCPELVNDNIVFIIERSTNGNIVVYEALMDDGQGGLDEKEPITVYWQEIDDDAMKKLTRQGRTSFRSELSAVERRLAYGISSKKVGQDRFELTLVALPSKPVELILVPDRSGRRQPRAITTINGRRSYLDKIFVESKTTLLLPKVLEVRLFGVTVVDGDVVTETIKP